VPEEGLVLPSAGQRITATRDVRQSKATAEATPDDHPSKSQKI